jgi:hypothetical protein
MLGMDMKAASVIALRRLLINVLMAFMIIAFAAVPMINLDPSVLHYQPLCQPNAQEATPGHTGTTYDNVFPVPTGVQVPILWYLVMAFSNGFTNAASAGLTCSPIDFRMLHTQLNTTQIQDPQLKQEVNDFYKDCYVPAYSDYLSNKLSPPQQTLVQQSLAQNGQTDVSWIGSQTLANVDGLYDAHSATHPCWGFSF